MSNDVLRNLLRLISIAWRRRYTIVIPLLIMPFVGLIVSFLSPKYYEAHTTILLQDTSELNPVLEDFSLSTSLEDRQAALKILLRSRSVLTAVALDIGYLDEESTQREIDEEIRELSRSLSIVFGGELIKIYYRSENQTDIAFLLETVTKHFLNLVLAPHKSWTSTSESFLKSQLERQREALSKAESNLASYKTKYALELPQLHRANISRLAELRQLLREKQTDLAGAEAAMEEFNSNLSQTNPVIGKLEERLIAIQAELSLLRSKYTAQHSKVQAALRELGRLENERKRHIAETSQLKPEDIKRLWNLAATSAATVDNSQPGTIILASQLQAVQDASTRVTSLINEVASIKKITREMEDKVQSFTRVERALVELQRDYDVKQKLFEDYLNRYEIARVSGDLGRYEEVERVKIIDAPFTPSSPNALPAALFIVAGFFAGLGIGTGLIAIAEISDTSLRLREPLESMTGIPVITRLPTMPQALCLTYNPTTDTFSEDDSS
ncbi:MAG: GumC family protein [Endozoicomonas sp.]